MGDVVWDTTEGEISRRHHEASQGGGLLREMATDTSIGFAGGHIAVEDDIRIYQETSWGETL